MADEALLIRFRRKDSREGVSRATMKAIAEALDLSETAAVHRGLVELAQRYVPQYPRDNGPVTEQQHRAIAEAVRSKHGEWKRRSLQPCRRLPDAHGRYARLEPTMAAFLARGRACGLECGLRDLHQ